MTLRVNDGHIITLITAAKGLKMLAVHCQGKSVCNPLVNKIKYVIVRAVLKPLSKLYNTWK